ncbi:MAG: hypothetical protein FJ220_04840 [Kiritimatiellaceae bacterium]|nr:hypothetical protein [Kiritimatiellaceae bacterium]
MKKFKFPVQLILLCLMLPMGGMAEKVYQPIMADPMFEPWRWKHVEALDGLGVLCMGEGKDGTLWL